MKLWENASVTCPDCQSSTFRLHWGSVHWKMLNLWNLFAISNKTELHVLSEYFFMKQL